MLLFSKITSEPDLEGRGGGYLPGIIGISFLFRRGSGDVEPKEAWRFLKWLGSEQTDDRSRVTMSLQISGARRIVPT